MTVEWELLTQEVIDVLEVGDPVWVVLNETCEKALATVHSKPEGDVMFEIGAGKHVS